MTKPLPPFRPIPLHPNPTTYAVPDEAAWYVRGGLSRAISSVRDSIRAADKFLGRYELPSDNPKHIKLDDEYAKELYDQTLSVRRYNEEWLIDALKAYESLPKELKPSNITEE